MSPHRDVDKRLIPVAFVIALLVGAGTSPAIAEEKEGGPIGYIIAKQGEVSTLLEGRILQEAALRQEVSAGSEVATGPRSSGKILFDDNTVLSISENTRVAVETYELDRQTARRATVLRMTKGRIKVQVADFYAETNSRFEVHTPSTVASSRGTTFVVWTVMEGGAPVSGVAVTSGSVQVTNLVGQSVVVPTGQFTVSSRYNPPKAPAALSLVAQVQRHVQAAEVSTDPTLVPQVNLQMAQQEQAAKQVVAQASFAAAVEVSTAAVSDAGTQGGAGGVSPEMGTTNTPCQVISPSGNLPLGCTPQ